MLTCKIQTHWGCQALQKPQWLMSNSCQTLLITFCYILAWNYVVSNVTSYHQAHVQQIERVLWCGISLNTGEESWFSIIHPLRHTQAHSHTHTQSVQNIIPPFLFVLATNDSRLWNIEIYWLCQVVEQSYLYKVFKSQISSRIVFKNEDDCLCPPFTRGLAALINREWGFFCPQLFQHLQSRTDRVISAQMKMCENGQGSLVHSVLVRIGLTVGWTVLKCVGCFDRRWHDARSQPQIIYLTHL